MATVSTVATVTSEPSRESAFGGGHRCLAARKDGARTTIITAALVFSLGGCLVDFSVKVALADAGPVCGNQRAETGESCDGSDLAGQSCESLSLGPGILGCQANCSGYDYSGCGLPGCGDGIREGNEACDGSALAGETCESLGWGPGVLACQSDCVAFETAACARIGLGEPCVEADQCAGGLCFAEVSTGAPGGFCTSDCESGLDCLPGFGCFLVEADQWVCLERCTAGADSCRSGYACIDPANLGETICWPQCQQDADCPSVGVCDLWTGLCRQTASGADNGAPCLVPSDCKSGLCRTELPDGYCVSHCVLSVGLCPQDGACVNAYEGALGDLGQCYDGCSTSNDCRAGWECVIPSGSTYLVCWSEAP